MDPIYQLCQVNIETINHLLFHCPITGLIWRALLSSIPHIQPHTTVFILLTSLLTNGDQEMTTSSLYILWMIWKARNEVTFQQRRSSPVKKIIADAWRLIDKYAALTLS